MTPDTALQDPDQIREAVQQRVADEQAAHGIEYADTPQAGQIPEKEIMDALSQGEDGDAGLFIHLHQGRLLYDHAAAQWHVWAGHFWQEDVLDEATASVQAVIEVYRLEARRQSWLRDKAENTGQTEIANKHKTKGDALFKRCRELHTARRKRAVLSLARAGNDSLGDTGQNWDVNPWLLACQNGVIDLKTGILRPGKPDDLIKTACPAKWIGIDTPAPIWEKFLSSTFEENEALISYMARILGYGVTGLTTQHIHPILYGKGRNGKGVLLETLKHVLGNLAFKAKSEILLLDRFPKSSGSADSDTLALRGKRLVWASETNEGRRLNAGKLKELVGGDTLNARGVYAKRPVEFRPSHLLLLLTNEKPHAPAHDFALWERLHLIPFNVSFMENPDPDKPKEKQADPDLLEKLKAEAPGILAWLVRGCLAWQKQGLNPPQIVKDATQEYKDSEDLISQFLEDCCTTNSASQVRASELYAAYKSWTDESGLRPMTNVRFGKQIVERFDRCRIGKGNVYIGLSLNNEE